METSQELIRRILETVGRAELRRVRGTIGSRTLREALRLVIDEGRLRADLFIPHYWAIYYHDGRGSVSPTSASKLVFFDDPSDDQRVTGSGERASQVRRLTRNEYRRGLEINRDRAKAGRRPFMYVVDRVGPTSPNPFFDRLGQGAARRAGGIIPRLFDDYIQALVDDERRRGGNRGDAKGRLGS